MVLKRNKISHLLVSLPYLKIMKLLILTAGLGLYIVLGLFVLFTQGNIYLRLMALFIFPLALCVIILYPHIKKIIRPWSEGKKNQRSLEGSSMTLDMAYRILDLPRNATHEQVNQQYRKLIHVVHPDVGGVTHLAKLLNEAKNIIISHTSDSK